MARPARQRLEIEEGYTTCKTCNRLIRVEHADDKGNCSVHAKPAPKEEDADSS